MMDQTITETWIGTREIADMFGVTITAVGNWFRHQIIPPEHTERVIVERRNGLMGLEWRARASFIRAEFTPPDAKGGRHKRKE